MEYQALAYQRTGYFQAKRKDAPDEARLFNAEQVHAISRSTSTRQGKYLTYLRRYGRESPSIKKASNQKGRRTSTRDSEEILTGTR